MNDVAQPHDSAFKKALSNLKIASLFLRHHLPHKMQLNICFSTLKLISGSFVGGDLKKSFTDILYSLDLKNGQKGYIHILVEHQSSAEHFMPLRLEKYKSEIMLRHVCEFGFDKPPIVYPIVLYNGQSKYTQPTEYYSLFDDPEFARDVMQRPFHLIDLSQMSDEELLKQGYHGIIEMILKNRKISDFLDFFKKITPFLQEIEKFVAGDITASLINYLISIHKVDDLDTMEQLVNQCFHSETQEAYMTGLESYIERGRAEGREEGREEGSMETHARYIDKFLAEGWSLARISSFTGISLDELKNKQ